MMKIEAIKVFIENLYFGLYLLLIKQDFENKLK
jgi:hypothetical protein